MKILSIVIITLSISCMSHRHIVGTGPKKGYQETTWQPYILGLVPLGNSIKSLTKGKSNYTIYTRRNLLDWFISVGTFGLIKTRSVTIYE